MEARAAEVSDESQSVTFVYDESVWSGTERPDGPPELTCLGESCGGETAACSVTTLDRPADGLSTADFLEGLRLQIGPRILDSARSNAAGGPPPELVDPARVAAFGDKSGVALSLRLTLHNAPTRIDYVWFASASHLVALNCAAPEATYQSARPAFETVARDLRIAP